MAPLYKRYIPPKPSAAPPVLTTSPDPNPQPAQAISNGEPNKRKRERTEEEVEERKATKLRKKGVDPATAQSVQESQDVAAGAKATEPSNGVASNSNNAIQSEFAHVKDTKKRHKLEKEARKARIAAEKEATSNLRKPPISGEDSGGQRAPSRGNDDQSQIRHDELPQEKKKKKAKRRKDDNDEPIANVEQPAEPAIANDPEPEVKKVKKTKRKDVTEATHDEEFSAAEPAPATPQSVESQPKKRRHKLEAVLRGSEETTLAPEDEGDSDLKKHGSILKKYQKSAELSQLAPRPAPKSTDSIQPESVLLDLGPLPQPEPAQIETFVPDDSALPEWLAKPTIISGDGRESFASLKLNPKITDHLRKLGFQDVLPVQKALIPLLLPPGSQGAQFFPGTESVLPDIAVGAPTGSGKTIAYLLPVIESLKLKPRTADGCLRALIVVPTRELVMQVAAVAESLSKGSTIKVGMATGSGAFKDEQAKLIKHGRKYEPEGYRALIAKADRRNYPPDEDSDDFEKYLDELEEQDTKMEQRIKDTVKGVVDYVPTYTSAVDILVATPGRLLDHLKSTLGFSLSHLEFLVLDEADKLLDLQYDGFLETVNNELERPRDEDEQDAREKFLRAKEVWDERKERRVRKVVLSATMTRDISKLVVLKLKRPRMIVVRGSEDQNGDVEDAEAGAVKQDGSSFELPPTLREFCVPVGDGSEKPLFLTELLRTRILNLSGDTWDRSAKANATRDDSDDSEDSASDSDSSSTNSDSESDSITNTSDSEDEEEVSPVTSPIRTEPEPSMHPSRTALLQFPSTPTVLIFTSSNESAARLTHFLKYLQPSWSNYIHTMTRTESRPKFANTSSTNPIISVSTDRAGRGLDTIGTRQITHVIQYDVPRSLTAYVHRVGRTARAGRVGEAWTLYGHSEARWLFKEIAGRDVKGVKRTGDVEKVKISVEDEELKERLGEVVEEVKGRVFGGRRG